MKKLLIAILLLAPAFLVAQDTKSNPSNYTITVHVQSSQLITVCGTDSKGSDCGLAQTLKVTIDGRKYEIQENGSRQDLLRTGDYKARIFKDETKQAYEYRRVYELQFANGKTRQYAVVGEME
jgi:hypothetical protein